MEHDGTYQGPCKAMGMCVWRPKGVIAYNPYFPVLKVVGLGSVRLPGRQKWGRELALGTLL